MAAFADFEVFDRAGGSLGARGLTDWDMDVFRAGKDIKEPANESRDADAHPDDGDGKVGDKACKSKREAEGRDDWPSGGLRDFDFVWISGLVIHGVACTLRT